MLVLIYALVAIGITLFLMAFARSKPQEDITLRVRRLQERVNTGALNPAVAQQATKMAQAMAQSRHILAPLVKRVVNADRIANIQPLLAHAGRYEESAADLIAQQVFMAIAFPLGFVILNIGLFQFELGLTILFFMGSAYLGFRWPLISLNRQTKSRQQAIFRSLPDALDLMTICVEAGLGINGALQAVVARAKPSPIRDEMDRTLREMQLGKPRAQAWRDLSARVNLRELSSFAIAMVQAEQMGTGLAKTLKVQSQLLREARWRFAQEKAQTAPIKMAIPLALFIFPVIFIVIFGPIVLKFIIDGAL
ncbi:MAG: type II secretion system F family protein [Candidatus Sericytochromatia bacterium]|nr:type II secretion system F family protein [Candidatus Sericytochromatia bacterium]